MALSPRTVSIVGSLVISAFLIAGAFFITSPWAISIADAGATDELLAEYAKKDTDADGLPDWQESLYRTDPNNAHSVDPNLTDKEAVATGKVAPAFTSETPVSATTVDVPGVNAAATTITDRFARQFFEQYLSGRKEGTTPSAEEVSAFINDAIADLKAQDVAATTYARSEVRVGVSGVAGLKAYAGAAAQAFVRNAVQNEKDDLSYFRDAMLKDDATALKKIADISGAYKGTARDLMAVSVPPELVDAHLALANALMRMSHATGNLAALKTDPLRAYLGLAEYNDTGEGMLRAFITMHDLFKIQQVTFTSDEAGFLFGELLTQSAGTP